ncbi:hypothetical protein VNI00_006499 [Paramarasmius palmivorus]|uniref:Major facilitator superfamily (MFS) profile domain-containing protein n=1 Tax=Paramarasmius palmivorus TaxID=297713 RepID=A0AAW0D4W1_9AGAR
MSTESKYDEKSDLSARSVSPLDKRIVPWWKLDIQIIPIVTGMYLLNFLDRGNIGNARVAGLQKSLGISDQQRFGAHTVLPILIVAWGAVTAFQGLITSYAGLVACRVVLGICEGMIIPSLMVAGQLILPVLGGLLPGVSLYVASFYPRSKLQFRVALFFASTALAGAFSGLLASAISHLDGRGGRPGWAYIFILASSPSYVADHDLRFH